MLQHVAGLDRDQERERRIEAAGDADVERSSGGKLLDPLGQARALDAEDLGAAAMEFGSFGRHERRAGHDSLQSPGSSAASAKGTRRNGRAELRPSRSWS